MLAADRGYSVVSGGARGVDEAAMLGALEVEGTAVGVLASDLLQICTSAKYRDAIVHSNLVLVAATNPEARFSVGTAMGRNKYIYCLADAAVVVHSGTKGGTWSGANENLKKRWVPLWVKETSDPASGNHAMLKEPEVRPSPLGLDQFPFETFFLHNAQHLGPTALRDVTPPEQPQELVGPLSLAPVELPAEALSFYQLFVRKLPLLCWEACRPDELLESLDLQRGQLDVWLKQAVAEGHIVKLSRPVRYQVPRQRRAFVD
jgi:predicted Rossmann fold nucleotide-binding protein DprA/Smf involved in DNA uptake